LLREKAWTKFLGTIPVFPNALVIKLNNGDIFGLPFMEIVAGNKQLESSNKTFKK
jgi:hypothetical protein